MKMMNKVIAPMRLVLYGKGRWLVPSRISVHSVSMQ